MLPVAVARIHAVGAEGRYVGAVYGRSNGDDTGDAAAGKDDVIQRMIGAFGSCVRVAAAAMYGGHEHTVFGDAHLVLEIAWQLFHDAGHGQLGHKTQAAHVDAHQRDTLGRNRPVHPEDGPVAADGNYEVGIARPLAQIVSILGAQDPGVGAEVEFSDDGVGQVQRLGDQIVIGDADGFHGRFAIGVLSRRP